jgi:hypothetical protein
MPPRRTGTRSNAVAGILLASIVALAAWAVLLALTGGVDLRSLGVRFSSRDPFRPALVAIVLGLVYAAAFPRRAEGEVARLRDATERLAPVLAIGMSLFTLILGLRFGTFVAGGPDPYGYVSQADLWVAGDLIIEQPLARQVPWPHADWTLAPLGYRPAVSGGAIVPTYAPGLPILMAMFKVSLAAFGMGPCGPYLVGPIAGALLSWLTYTIGRRLWSKTTGAGAAALIASSPAFVAALFAPMSDVPVATFFLAAAVLALSSVRARAFWAGLAISMAILVRPNLVPVAAVFAAYFSWRAQDWSTRLRTVALFGVGVLPGILAVAAINTHLYGAPWKSGYGELAALYSWRHATTNLGLYARWLIETQTPLVAAGVIPFLAWRRVPPEHQPGMILLAAVALVIWLSYLWYLPFDTWEYLRFLLVPISVILVLAVIGLNLLLSTRSGTWRQIIQAGVVVAVVGYQIGQVRDQALTRRWEGEAAYVSTGRFVADTLPRNAVLLSMIHSGSLRHYSGRLTIRYDWIDRHWWTRTLNALTALGYRPYVVLHDWEESGFRKHLGLAEAAAIPGAIIAEHRDPGVRVYDPLSLAEGSSVPMPIRAMTPCPCTSKDGVRPR